MKIIFKCIIISIAFLSLIQVSLAQITFQKLYGRNMIDNDAYNVTQTADGGYIAIGGSSLLFATALPSDILIVKTNAMGDIIWTKIFGEPIDTESGRCIQQTADGGYIISAYSVSSNSIYLIKTDSNGDILWANAINIASSCLGLDLKITASGEYIIAGYRNNYFGTNQESFLIKADANGNVNWVKSYDVNHCSINSIVLCSDGGYIMAGSSYPPITATSLEMYVLKTDSGGNPLWSKTYGRTFDDAAISIKQTLTGGYVIAGNTSNNVSGVFGEIYMVNIDSLGNMLWSKTLGTPYFERAFSIESTLDSCFVIAGYTVDSLQKSHAILLKSDSIGNLNWSKFYGTVLLTDGHCVLQSQDGGYMISGHHMTPGVGDFYLIKTDANGTSGCNEASIAMNDSVATTVVNTVTTIVDTLPYTATPIIFTEDNGFNVNTICVTGIDESATLNKKFIVAPNPNNGTFEISYSLLQDKNNTLQIIDLVGRVVYQKQLSTLSTNQIIYVSKLFNGIYFARIANNKDYGTIKFVKN